MAQEGLKIKLYVVVVVPRPILVGQRGGPKHEMSVLVCVFGIAASHKRHSDAHDRPKRPAQKVALIIDEMRGGWKSGKDQKVSETTMFSACQSGPRIVQEGFEN